MQEINIGQAARISGVSAKMIRHYEEIGLIPRAGRTASGYRVYSDRDLYVLNFIRQGRNLGFSIEQIRELLNLWENKRRTSRKVKELALNHIQELDERIRELHEIRQAISHLIKHCHGDDRPDCPILEVLAVGDNTKHTSTYRHNHNRHLVNKKHRQKSKHM